MDTQVNKEFILHAYNHDADSFRSPWSNTFFPPNPDCAFYPSAYLRALEQKANDVFCQYVNFYYDYAVSSVYFVDDTRGGFMASFLVKRELKNEKQVKYGSLDATHAVTCNLKGAPKVEYKINSTFMI